MAASVCVSLLVTALIIITCLCLIKRGKLPIWRMLTLLMPKAQHTRRKTTGRRNTNENIELGSPRKKYKFDHGHRLPPPLPSVPPPTSRRAVTVEEELEQNQNKDNNNKTSPKTHTVQHQGPTYANLPSASKMPIPQAAGTATDSNNASDNDNTKTAVKQIVTPTTTTTTRIDQQRQAVKIDHSYSQKRLSRRARSKARDKIANYYGHRACVTDLDTSRDDDEYDGYDVDDEGQNYAENIYENVQDMSRNLGPIPFDITPTSTHMLQRRQDTDPETGNETIAEVVQEDVLPDKSDEAESNPEQPTFAEGFLSHTSTPYGSPRSSEV